MKVLSFAMLALVALAATTDVNAADERNLRSAMTNHQQHHQAANHHQAGALEARKVAQQHPAMEARHQQRHQAVNHHQHQTVDHHHAAMEARDSLRDHLKKQQERMKKLKTPKSNMEAKAKASVAIGNKPPHAAAAMESENIFNEISALKKKLKKKKNASMEAAKEKNQ